VSIPQNNKESMSLKNDDAQSILSSTIKMAMATMTSRVLGLVRELVMASQFGASGLTDAYNVAFRIPNILRDLFAEGAFSSAFVPVFVEVHKKDPKKARSLLWSVFIILVVATGLICVGIINFAPELIQMFTSSKFTENEERFSVTVTLLRIMAPFLSLVSIAALFMGALNTLKIFFVPSLAPAFFNVVMICSMFFLPPILQARGVPTILALGFGVVAGGLAQLLVQIPLIFKKNLSPKGPIELKTPHTKKILGRLGIGTIGLAATQINILVTTILATGTVLGAVSWLNYAFRLFQFPVGVLSVSLAGPNLVHFSEAYSQNNLEKAKAVLQSSYHYSFFLLLPAMALLYSLADETVWPIFKRGAFLAEDVEQTSRCLRLYIIGLPFYGLYKIFSPLFFSMNRPKLPVYISMGAISLNIIFCLLLTPQYGFTVLALGTSLSMGINAVVQGRYLKKILHLPLNFFISRKIFIMCGSSLILALVTNYLGERFFVFNDLLLAQIVTYGVICLIGLGLYFSLLYLLGVRTELNQLLVQLKLKKNL
jgi:putative peptidoglycan lipid II flippase